MSIFFKKWLIVVKLRVCDRKLAQHSRKIAAIRREQFSVELDRHVRNLDLANAWKLCRLHCGVLKGRQTTQYRPPPSNPTSQQLLAAYCKPADQGGWNGEEIMPERIDELELHEKTFCGHHLHDGNIDILKQNFATAVTRAPNRKSIVPGEVPSELWRIVMRPEWLIPGFRYPHGVGYQAGFGELAQVSKRIHHLFASMMHFKIVPITSICCFGVRPPPQKK